MLRVRLALGRHASTSSASSAAATNWLEANCGDVPTHPRVFDTASSEMLRGGHALQVANRALLGAHVRPPSAPPACDASRATVFNDVLCLNASAANQLKSSSRVSAPTRDPTHVETLQVHTSDVCGCSTCWELTACTDASEGGRHGGGTYRKRGGKAQRALPAESVAACASVQQRRPRCAHCPLHRAKPRECSRY